VTSLLVAVLIVAAAADESKPPLPEIRPRAPQMSAVFPQGAEQGKTIKAEVIGQSLDRASAVVFLDSSISGKIESSTHGKLTMTLTIAPDAFFGPHYFRIISPRGASNLLLFRVGDLPHITEAEPNSSFAEAQTVKVPATIQGRMPVDQDTDFFRFRAEKGQTLVFDVRASRNGSGLDASLVLLDASGRKLEHDEDHFIWDPFFSHTFREAGEYTAVIQPTHAHNDAGFAYQLDIRTSPHVQSLHPIALQPGAEVIATLHGAGFSESDVPLWFETAGFSGQLIEARGDTARARIRVPAGAKSGPYVFAIVTPRGRSNTAQFFVDDTPRHGGGSAIQIPTSITGIAQYHKPERFTFEAEAGQTLLFEVRAMRLGAMVDATLRIFDEAGKQIAFNDDGNFAGVQFNKDPQLLHTFAKAGRYAVEIRNLWKVAGENHPYQLVIRKPQPAGEAMLPADVLPVARNGAATFKVSALRKEGFTGPIPFVLEGLPAGVRSENAEIAAGKNEAEVRVHAADLPVGSHGQFRVVANGEPAWRSVRISSGGGEGATFGTTRAATLVITEPAHYSLEAAASAVNLVRGGAARVNVNIKRAANFADAIKFSFENLPEGVVAEEASSSTAEAILTLRAAETAPTGRQRIIILGRTDSGETQEAPRITLVVD